MRKFQGKPNRERAAVTAATNLNSDPDDIVTLLQKAG